MLPNTSILIAIPTSLQDLEQAKGVVHKDYINTGPLRGGKISVEVAWYVISNTYLNSVNSLIKWGNSHGISVVERASLEDLKLATEICDVIAIVAHWKDYRFLSTDILAGVSEIRSALASQGDTILLVKLLDEEPNAENPERMAAFLSNQIAAFDRWLTLDLNGAERIVTTKQYVFSKARERLDHVLAGLVVPGSRLELYDELHTAESVAECFDSSWEGFCDFACCHSNYLSETAKIRASSALFRINEKPLNPSQVFPYLADTLRLINNRSLTYQKASTIIRDRGK